MMRYIFNNVFTATVFSCLILTVSCKGDQEQLMKPQEFARHVSDIIVDGTQFRFEPALEKFEQDGAYLIDIPSNKKGTFYTISTLKVNASKGANFSPKLAISYQAGSIEVFINGLSVYQHFSKKDGHFNHVDYGLYEWEESVPIRLEKGEYPLVIKYTPLNAKNNRVYLSFIRTDNGLPYTQVEIKAPTGKESLQHYGYWWVGPLDESAGNSIISSEAKASELVAQHFISANGNKIRWGLPALHLVKSLPGWLTYQNWHYSGGTFLDAMSQVSEHFSTLDYSDYITEHRNFLSENIRDIEAMREDYGLIESPFGHFFRASLLDDMGMQTVPYVNYLIKHKELLNKKNSFDVKLISRVSDYILHDAPRLADGTFARFTPDSMTVWADDLFMSSILLLRMHELTGEEKYLNEVIKQVILFDKHLYNAEDNLYWHGWFSRTQTHSSTKWARANGWTMMTKTELLKAMPDDHPQKSKILNIFKRHAAGLLKVQARDGRWHQVLDDPNSYLETSATAMFVRAFAAGINYGWLENEAYRKAAIRGWGAMTGQIDKNGDVLGIVRGTPIMFSDKEYANWGTRKNDPRGLGALLYAAIEMDKLFAIKKD